eukprot:3057548-Prorocentrum_lima.AAC.1
MLALASEAAGRPDSAARHSSYSASSKNLRASSTPLILAPADVTTPSGDLAPRRHGQSALAHGAAAQQRESDNSRFRRICFDRIARESSGTGVSAGIRLWHRGPKPRT